MGHTPLSLRCFGSPRQYSDARVYQKSGKATKVLYGAYPTQNQAQKQLNKLKGNQVFNQAWIISVDD